MFIALNKWEYHDVCSEQKSKSEHLERQHGIGEMCG
jgi:hypothetical protein